MVSPGTLWTIGHSTHPIEVFIEWVLAFRIECIVDIRAFPGSRRYPHFNKENLCQFLSAQSVMYQHLPSLGGRRKPLPDSPNHAWKNASFRGYADHMLSDEFKMGVGTLERLAKQSRVACMCAEAPWWRCHRALLSDHLKIKNWKVLHIMGRDKTTEHPFTSPARNVQGDLFYN